MNSKRKLRPTAILGIALFLAVVIFAVVIVVKTLNYGDDAQEEELFVSEGVEDNDVPDNPVQPDTEEDAVVPAVNEDIPEISPSAPQPLFTQEELLSMYPDSTLASSADAGDEYLDKIYFVGDSTTHGMKYYGVLSGGKETTRVWTPRSGTLAMWNLLSEKVVVPENNEEVTIPEAVVGEKPEIIVFTLGVNGVSSCSKEQFVGYYKDLIDEVKTASSDTVIILQSIYPVCSDYQYVNSISMEKINTANAWIAELANENGCYFLNTTSVLVDETGYLKPSYSNGDGIHISPEGFGVILNYIKTHAID